MADPKEEKPSINAKILDLRNANAHGDALQCLGLIKLYLQNIVKNTKDEKFRTITISNPNVQWKISPLVHGIELIEAIGFTRASPDLLDYKSADIDPLKKAIAVIDAEEKSLKAAIASLPKEECLGEIKLSRSMPDMNASLRFRVGFADSLGRRKTMEDEMVVLGMGPRSLPKEDYYAIFDGHSGTEAAILASKNLHVKLDKNLRLRKSEGVEKALIDAFSETSAMMAQKSMRCGTCALVVFIDEEKIYVANLGDSRAVLGQKKNTGRRITVDHKPDSPGEVERIEKLGGTVKNVGGVYRVQGELAVCRALGDIHMKPFVSDVPDVFQVPYPTKENDSCFIILACDGIWDEITDEGAIEIVYKSRDPLTAAKEILSEAFKRGSSDNLSVIVIYLRPRDEWNDKSLERKVKKRSSSHAVPKISIEDSGSEGGEKRTKNHERRKSGDSSTLKDHERRNSEGKTDLSNLKRRTPKKEGESGPLSPRSASNGPLSPRSASNGPLSPRSASNGPVSPRRTSTRTKPSSFAILEEDEEGADA